MNTRTACCVCSRKARAWAISEYASSDYTDLLKENGINISMSRKANPWDDAACESFMKTLKYEEVASFNQRPDQCKSMYSPDMSSGQVLSLKFATPFDFNIQLRRRRSNGVGEISYCPAAIRANGSVAIPAQRLSDYVRMLPDGELVLKAQNTGWVALTCGRSRSRIATLSPESFPELPKPPREGASF